MPRRKCDSDVTDARDTPPRGRKRTSTPAPVWPKVGDFVRCKWSETRTFEGIVIDARDRGWKPPMLTILTGDGERMMWSSPHVVIMARRRKRRKR
jgi:hypothetical protein